MIIVHRLLPERWLCNKSGGRGPLARSTVAIVGSHAAAARRMAVDSARRGAGRGGRRAGTDVTHPSTHPRGGSSRPVEGRARRLKNCGRRPAFSAGRFRPGAARRHDIAGPGGETTRRCAVAPWRPLGIGLADDQRREHRPAAGAQDAGDHPRQLHVGLLQRPSVFPTGCRGPPDVWTGIAAACTRSGFAAPETCQLTVRFPDRLPGTAGRVGRHQRRLHARRSATPSADARLPAGRRGAKSAGWRSAT